MNYFHYFHVFSIKTIGDDFKLSGVDFTKEEQAAQLKALKKQLKLKQELLAKYRKLGDTAAFLQLGQQEA